MQRTTLKAFENPCERGERSAERQMVSRQPTPLLAVTPSDFAAHYNRMPFGFGHNLHRLDLFKDASLQALCLLYADHPQDYFVSQSAPQPGTVFYAVPRAGLRPHEAFDQLAPGSYKILLKRLENHDDRFHRLLHDLFNHLKDQLRYHGYCDEVVRLESSIFISAPWSTTPFHFDPEVNFFSQIEGEKVYHLYAPSALGEDEVEPLYVRATVDIGQVDLGRRDHSVEQIFTLRPGTGVHQPQDSPHWVETTASRSISYTFVYETRESRARARVRSFNHYLRRLNIEPAPLGIRPNRDAVKAATMAAVIPVRKRIGRTLRGARSLVTGAPFLQCGGES